MKYHQLVPLLSLSLIASLTTVISVNAQTSPAEELNLAPEIIEGSPVLQRWFEEVPNVLEDIRTEPSFPTRVRLGYSELGGDGGITVGVEDVFLGDTGFTVSGEYQNHDDKQLWGANLRYYLLPLGNYVNIAPVVGYRSYEVNNYQTDGLEVGAKVNLAFSRGGAGDVSLSQTYISPTDGDEVGLTTLSVGYAVAENWRISTDIQNQNSRVSKDTRYSVLVEWLPNW